MSASAAEERASWSSWAGSPELIAHIGRTAEAALRERLAVPVGGPPAGEPVVFRATVNVGRDAEVFESPQALLERITPEARAGCQSVELSAESDEVRARVVFTFARNRERAGVRLRVSSANPSRGNEVAAVAATVAMAVQRGFRRQLGQVKFTSGLSEGNVGVRAPFATAIEAVTPVALGVATGLAVSLCLNAFVPDTKIPDAARLTLTVALGTAYPLWLVYAIPNVELALDGKTRLYRAARWAIAALATLLLTTAVKALLGSD
jgi:hypothetical protein